MKRSDIDRSGLEYGDPMEVQLEGCGPLSGIRCVYYAGYKPSRSNPELLFSTSQEELDQGIVQSVPFSRAEIIAELERKMLRPRD